MTDLTPEQNKQVDKILDWQSKACIIAAIEGMELNEVNITRELIDKYRGEAKQQLLSLIQEEKVKEFEILQEMQRITKKTNITYLTKDGEDYVIDRLQALKQEGKS